MNAHDYAAAEAAHYADSQQASAEAEDARQDHAAWMRNAKAAPNGARRAYCQRMAAEAREELAAALTRMDRWTWED